MYYSKLYMNRVVSLIILLLFSSCKEKGSFDINKAADKIRKTDSLLRVADKRAFKTEIKEDEFPLGFKILMTKNEVYQRANELEKQNILLADNIKEEDTLDIGYSGNLRKIGFNYNLKDYSTQVPILMTFYENKLLMFGYDLTKTSSLELRLLEKEIMEEYGEHFITKYVPIVKGYEKFWYKNNKKVVMSIVGERGRIRYEIL